MKKFLCYLLFLLTSWLLPQSHFPEKSWVHFQTDNILFHVEKKLTNQILPYLPEFYKCYLELEALVYGPGKSAPKLLNKRTDHIIFGDFPESSGYAFSLKNKIYFTKNSIYRSFPYRKRQSWELSVFVHELAHIFTLDKLQIFPDFFGGLSLGFNSETNRYGVSLLSRISPDEISSGMAEGLAQYYAYRLSHDSYDNARQMFSRTLLLAGNAPTWRELYNFFEKGTIEAEALYNFSFAFLLYLERNISPNLIDDTLQTLVPGETFQSALQRNILKALEENENFVSHLHAFFPQYKKNKFQKKIIEILYESFLQNLKKETAQFVNIFQNSPHAKSEIELKQAKGFLTNLKTSHPNENHTKREPLVSDSEIFSEIYPNITSRNYRRNALFETWLGNYPNEDYPDTVLHIKPTTKKQFAIPVRDPGKIELLDKTIYFDALPQSGRGGHRVYAVNGSTREVISHSETEGAQTFSVSKRGLFWGDRDLLKGIFYAAQQSVGTNGSLSTNCSKIISTIKMEEGTVITDMCAGEKHLFLILFRENKYSLHSISLTNDNLKFQPLSAPMVTTKSEIRDLSLVEEKNFLLFSSDEGGLYQIYKLKYENSGEPILTHQMTSALTAHMHPFYFDNRLYLSVHTPNFFKTVSAETIFKTKEVTLLETNRDKGAAPQSGETKTVLPHNLTNATSQAIENYIRNHYQVPALKHGFGNSLTLPLVTLSARFDNWKFIPGFSIHLHDIAGIHSASLSAEFIKNYPHLNFEYLFTRFPVSLTGFSYYSETPESIGIDLGFFVDRYKFTTKEMGVWGIASYPLSQKKSIDLYLGDVSSTFNMKEHALLLESPFFDTILVGEQIRLYRATQIGIGWGSFDFRYYKTLGSIPSSLSQVSLVTEGLFTKINRYYTSESETLKGGFVEEFFLFGKGVWFWAPSKNQHFTPILKIGGEIAHKNLPEILKLSPSRLAGGILQGIAFREDEKNSFQRGSGGVSFSLGGKGALFNNKPVALGAVTIKRIDLAVALASGFFPEGGSLYQTINYFRSFKKDSAKRDFSKLSKPLLLSAQLFSKSIFQFHHSFDFEMGVYFSPGEMGDVDFSKHNNVFTRSENWNIRFSATTGF